MGVAMRRLAANIPTRSTLDPLAAQIIRANMSSRATVTRVGANARRSRSNKARIPLKEVMSPMSTRLACAGTSRVPRVPTPRIVRWAGSILAAPYNESSMPRTRKVMPRTFGRVSLIPTSPNPG